LAPRAFLRTWVDQNLIRGTLWNHIIGMVLDGSEQGKRAPRGEAQVAISIKEVNSP